MRILGTNEKKRNRTIAGRRVSEYVGNRLPTWSIVQMGTHIAMAGCQYANLRPTIPCRQPKKWHHFYKEGSSK